MKYTPYSSGAVPEACPHICPADAPHASLLPRQIPLPDAGRLQKAAETHSWYRFHKIRAIILPSYIQKRLLNDYR